MVIDLTQDSDSDDQIRSQRNRNTHSIIPTFFSHLTHRTSSSLSLVPSKRKSEGSLDLNLENVPLKRNSSSVASERHQSRKLNGYGVTKLQPSTPSPSPATQPISVVVPSPSRQLKREIEAAEWALPSRLTRPFSPEETGLSQKYYPTDAHEKRVRKGMYPAARKVNRDAIPLPIAKPGPILLKKPAARDQLYRTLERKLSMIKGPPVTFAPGDGFKLANVTSNFEFVNSYKVRKGVSPAPSEFIGGCGCSEYCDPKTCLCSEREDGSTINIIPYQQAKDRPDILVLTPEILKRTIMIAECGALCACDKNCWNRVVQRGRTVKLEIFDTGVRGFGLRSPEYIRAGQFIDCYLGEVITKKHADVREEIALKKGHSYLFGLDFSPEVEEDDMYVVDGERFGSATRFMNHSCKPNCRMFPVTHTIGDLRFYDLSFFALKDLPPMTELTFDYNPGGERSKQVDPNAVPCLCGEDNCRGQLWPNQRKGTK
ncbi:hypothetical protein ETB97_007592 [Aspergillus alliaceus]|uniref:Uncharacterized protein n=1 Tax=Petromyces alliaceus TaxID=209559 RepID=A0A5N7CK88_PETAA|nr:uncharacterized protein BDW43DRAFT_317189 [Aspergillus alliaceus]KAB8227034.1 hypothetical protein BDW43DRAFT_317189 [Aspergillus alliaceus]KAE8394237.1 hypothetical protein BDV23DRAFT_10492 [Aspergillus alliaceus]KAF5864488.1 hypothetical protein ETB97_007592 [Aspergillus burnettii]